MSGRQPPRRGNRGAAAPTTPRSRVVRAPLLLGGLALVIGALVAVTILSTRRSDVATPWARLGTADVHSLAFVGNDPNHVLFGHHGGILESRDGGHTWQPLPIGADAMGMRPAADGSIVIAGHLVFTASHDNGKTWQSIAAQDLPNLDIHGFARDPSDPARMWAALATGGLWESGDFGIHWTRVREDNVLLPVAVRSANTTRLIAITAAGLEASDDGGRSWTPIPTPPTYPMTALSATPDGKVMYAGSLDLLYRSDDSGHSWSPTSYKGSAFAIATSEDGRTVALVSQGTEYFRSTDGGQTWPGPR